MYARMELIGNLTADPKTKTVPVRGEQREVVEFSIAVNDPFNKEKPASFFNDIAAWNGVGKSVAQHLRKGDQLFVVCDAEMRSDEKDGVKRNHLNLTANTVRFLRSKRTEDTGRYDSAPPSETETQAAPVAEAPAATEAPAAEAPSETQMAVPF